MGRHRESEPQTRRHSQSCDIQAAKGACRGHRDHRTRRPSSPEQHQQHQCPAAAYSNSQVRAKSVAATEPRCCNCNHAESSTAVAPVCASGGGGGGGGGSCSSGGATVSAAATGSGGVGSGGGSHRSCRGSSCAKRLQQHQQQQQQQHQKHQNLTLADDPDGLGRAMRLANWSMLQKPPVVIGSKRPKEAPEWRGGCGGSDGSGCGSGFAGGHRICTRLS